MIITLSVILIFMFCMQLKKLKKQEKESGEDKM